MENVFDQVGQTIVHADEDLRLIVLWNGHCTLNSYSVSEDGKWDALDCCTLSEKPRTAGLAEKEAEEWIADNEPGECEGCFNEIAPDEKDETSSLCQECRESA